jgi:hypothetical protein
VIGVVEVANHRGHAGLMRPTVFRRGFHGTTRSGFSPVTQVLQPEVVARLREWLKTKKSLPDNVLLFPISDHVPGGVNRLTSTMMRLDLKAARKKWIEEVKPKKARAKREKTDFLKKILTLVNAAGG